MVMNHYEEIFNLVRAVRNIRNAANTAKDGSPLSDQVIGYAGWAYSTAYTLWTGLNSAGVSANASAQAGGEIKEALDALKQLLDQSQYEANYKRFAGVDQAVAQVIAMMDSQYHPMQIAPKGGAPRDLTPADIGAAYIRHPGPNAISRENPYQQPLHEYAPAAAYKIEPGGTGGVSPVKGPVSPAPMRAPLTPYQHATTPGANTWLPSQGARQARFDALKKLARSIK